MATYQLISSVTVGSGGAANIDFTSIPATYTDLCLVLSGRSGATEGYPYLQFNNNSGANYSMRRIRGDGSSAQSSSNSSQTSLDLYVIPGTNYTTSTFGSMSIYIPNYAGSTNKSVSVDGVAENNATAGYDYLIAGLWSQTTAINQITLYVNGNFVQYSTAYLYGIKNS